MCVWNGKHVYQLEKIKVDLHNAFQLCVDVFYTNKTCCSVKTKSFRMIGKRKPGQKVGKGHMLSKEHLSSVIPGKEPAMLLLNVLLTSLLILMIRGPGSL